MGRALRVDSPRDVPLRQQGDKRAFRPDAFVKSLTRLLLRSGHQLPTLHVGHTVLIEPR